MQKTQKPLTVGELSKRTGAPYYICQYLDRINKLPKEKKSTGKGDPSIFKIESIKIVLAHIDKNRGQNDKS
jgi:hypothetical protein